MTARLFPDLSAEYLIRSMTSLVRLNLHCDLFGFMYCPLRIRQCDWRLRVCGWSLGWQRPRLIWTDLIVGSSFYFLWVVVQMRTDMRQAADSNQRHQKKVAIGRTTAEKQFEDGLTP